ncbi:MAG: hypothetical protein EOP45_14450 [Sphingobacteriaceae bacterium]|nr:MAG: hypothetical protein EOP45_14450 [Sphingobacteriaceae bacterium]
MMPTPLIGYMYFGVLPSHLSDDIKQHVKILKSIGTWTADIYAEKMIHTVGFKGYVIHLVANLEEEQHSNSQSFDYKSGFGSLFRQLVYIGPSSH